MDGRKTKLLLPSGLQFHKTLGRNIVILLLYLLTSGMVLFVFIVRPGINGYDRAMFPDMVYGKAHKPFVYRTLLPSGVRALAEITPECVKERIRSTLQDKRMISILKWEKEYLYEYGVALIIMLSCFLGSAYQLRYLLRWFYDFPSYVADFAPMVGLLILPVFFKYYSYIYDPSTIFLFTLAIILIVKERIWLFYLVFLLATVNKETSILLVGIFFIREFKVMSKASLVRHLLSQMLLWIAVKAILLVIFRNNPGSFCESHLSHNLDLISAPFRLLYFVGVVLLFCVLICYRWTEKPSFLRKSLFITAVPLISLAFFFGFVDELRGYYEVFPFLFLLSVPTIVEIFELSG